AFPEQLDKASADRGLPRPFCTKKINSPKQPARAGTRPYRRSARLEAPPAKQLRVHPAAADGYRSRSGTPWSTRVFVEMRPALRGFGAVHIERIRRNATSYFARSLS